jgi:hypothetical protein
MEIWEKVKPIKDKKERHQINLYDLLTYDKQTIEKFKELSKYGEYDVKFLILVAQLLMIQEKTNYPKGKIFQKLLKRIKEGDDIFTILSTASMKKLS